MIGEESLSTYGEIRDLESRLAVAFERDDAGIVIVTEWRDDDAPTDDQLGQWDDDGGHVWEDWS